MLKKVVNNDSEKVLISLPFDWSIDWLIDWLIYTPVLSC